MRGRGKIINDAEHSPEGFLFRAGGFSPRLTAGGDVQAMG